jgi:hypothetical protein
MFLSLEYPWDTQRDSQQANCIALMSATSRFIILDQFTCSFLGMAAKRKDDNLLKTGPELVHGEVVE